MGSDVHRPAAAAPRTCCRGGTVTESERDVVDLLSADHRDFEAVFRQLDDLRGKADPASVQRKRQLVDQVTIGLAKHSVAEETLVYPRVERQVAPAGGPPAQPGAPRG